MAEIYDDEYGDRETIARVSADITQPPTRLSSKQQTVLEYMRKLRTEDWFSRLEAMGRSKAGGAGGGEFAIAAARANLDEGGGTGMEKLPSYVYAYTEGLREIGKGDTLNELRQRPDLFRMLKSQLLADYRADTDWTPETEKLIRSALDQEEKYFSSATEDAYKRLTGTGNAGYTALLEALTDPDLQQFGSEAQALFTAGLAFTDRNRRGAGGGASGPNWLAVEKFAHQKDQDQVNTMIALARLDADMEKAEFTKSTTLATLDQNIINAQRKLDMDLAKFMLDGGFGVQAAQVAAESAFMRALANPHLIYVPPGAEFVPGFEPGGVAERLSKQANIPFTPRPAKDFAVPFTGFDTAQGYQDVYQQAFEKAPKTAQVSPLVQGLLGQSGPGGQAGMGPQMFAASGGGMPTVLPTGQGGGVGGEGVDYWQTPEGGM